MKRKDGGDKMTPTQNLEIRYSGHHKYALYLNDEMIEEFDSFDEAADEYEALGGEYT